MPQVPNIRSKSVHPPVENWTMRRLRSILARFAAKGTRSCRGIFLTAIWLVYQYHGLGIKRLLDIQKDPHQYSSGTATEATSGFGSGDSKNKRFGKKENSASFRPWTANVELIARGVPSHFQKRTCQVQPVLLSPLCLLESEEIRVFSAWAAFTPSH